MSNPITKFCILIFSFFLITNCNPKVIPIVKAENEYIITNVSVIPMTSDTILHAQNVWIKSGRIVNLNTLTFPPTATIIEGNGKYIMPGLTEMHAHIPVAVNGNDSLVKETLFLYLSQGITTIPVSYTHLTLPTICSV